MSRLSFLQITNSRTVRTLAVAIGLQLWQWASADPAAAIGWLHLSPALNALAVTILGALATYYRANPVQHPAVIPQPKI